MNPSRQHFGRIGSEQIEELEEDSKIDEYRKIFDLERLDFDDK
jgi:hypothetical protein